MYLLTFTETEWCSFLPKLYCEKKLLKFEAEGRGREFAKLLRALEKFETVKGSEQLLVTECFF